MLDPILLVAGLLAMAAAASTRFARRLGVPAMLLFVGLGMLAGSSGPGGIVFGDWALSYNLGMAALALIVFAGGMETEVQTLRAALPPASLLATLGVVTKAGIVGLLAWLITPLSLPESMLLGAILAPTDAAAVFAVVKGRGLRPRLRGILEAESGTNDPVSIYLTVTLVGLLMVPDTPWLGALAGVPVQLLLGGLYGYAGGRLLVVLLNHTRIDSPGLYPVMALAGGMVTFSAANLLGGNGLLAIYVAGVVLGSRRLHHALSIRHFLDGAAWFAQIAVFLLLGLLVFPDRALQSLPWAVGITAAVLVARPLAVLVSILPLRRLGPDYHFSRADLILLSWGGLKGAVPIILGIVPVLHGLPEGETIFNIVFLVVLAATALQGLTLIPLARWLGLLEPEPPEPALRLELGGVAPPNSAILDLAITAEMPAAGARVDALQLPESVVVAALLRGEILIAPRGHIQLLPGDQVYIVVSDADAVGTPEAFQARPPTAEAAGDEAG